MPASFPVQIIYHISYFTCLWCDGVCIMITKLCRFIAECIGERILKIGAYFWATLHYNWMQCSRLLLWRDVKNCCSRCIAQKQTAAVDSVNVFIVFVKTISTTVAICSLCTSKETTASSHTCKAAPLNHFAVFKGNWSLLHGVICIVLKTVSVDQCSEVWSCWLTVQHD